MKILITLTGLCIFLFSCKKENIIQNFNHGSLSPVAFTKYTIKQGQQFCDENKFLQTSYSQLNFTAKFDSSVIYKSIDPNNQLDINKLYGFSDNNAQHQQFSARFGWGWSNNALHLYGYVYNDGIRNSKELGTVAIGSENSCSIKVNTKNYIFSLNGKMDSLARTSPTPLATGYKLYPYFGGNELAPHNISIWIKEL